MTKFGNISIRDIFVLTFLLVTAPCDQLIGAKLVRWCTNYRGTRCCPIANIRHHMLWLGKNKASLAISTKQLICWLCASRVSTENVLEINTCFPLSHNRYTHTHRSALTLLFWAKAYDVLDYFIGCWLLINEHECFRTKTNPWIFLGDIITSKHQMFSALWE